MQIMKLRYLLVMEYPKLMNDITNNILPFKLIQNFLTCQLIKKNLKFKILKN